MSKPQSQPAWVRALLDTDLTPTERLLLILLARYQGSNDSAWPKLTTLAQNLGTSERTVQRLIRNLCEKGRLTVDHPPNQGRGMENHYRVNVTAEGCQGRRPSWPLKGDTGDALLDAEGCHPCREKGDIHDGAYKKKQSVKQSVSQQSLQLATLLFELIRQRKSNFKEPDLGEWAIHVDRLIRLDGRKPERIEAVIRWCQADTTPRGKGKFCWANTVLSTRNLREHIDRLELNMSTKISSEPPAQPVVRDAAGRTPRELALAKTGGGA